MMVGMGRNCEIYLRLKEFEMKTSVHLTRSNGYRELGMFDQSILELEEIEGDDRWKYEVIKAKYLTYRDAKAFEQAEAMSKALRIYHNHLTEGWLLYVQSVSMKPKEQKRLQRFLSRTRIALMSKLMCCLRLVVTWL